MKQMHQERPYLSNIAQVKKCYLGDRVGSNVPARFLAVKVVNPSLFKLTKLTMLSDTAHCHPPSLPPSFTAPSFHSFLFFPSLSHVNRFHWPSGGHCKLTSLSSATTSLCFSVCVGGEGGMMERKSKR